ncbi:sterol desaturase family protein [Bradyrhizobium sp. SZCCHNR2035]|uniref:sterol desaturase family protein n=1 Tax=Bradyrhizobium sp. SZCCHNR2035 TaxID=3057386 RepID=UPI0029170455|nr:sterol desaturase family protein [Bradyrhizobium sp. SZCCHNR2035]
MPYTSAIRQTDRASNRRGLRQMPILTAAVLGAATVTFRHVACGDDVNQSRTTYYAELYIYPIVVAGLLLYELADSGLALHPRWFVAAACGAILWTLAEYLVHRFLYHEAPVLKDLHGMHHARPSDLVGAPIGVSAVIFCSWFFLVARVSDVEIASGSASGLILGYVLYLTVHDAVHRWPLSEDSWLRKHRLRHLRHHRDPKPGNFGVTTSFWDHVFGTAIVPKRARPQDA